MIICNITWNVSAGVLAQWKDWVQYRLLPLIEQMDARQLHFCKLLYQPEDGLTFTQQIGISDKQAFEQLQPVLHAELRDMLRQMGTSVVFFQTVMEEISLSEDLST
ncbi:MAG: DUF4286 family protein [Thermoflavifilum sp.]|nr:DUF4286 family protein [Thermoflavifilum sp.]